MPITIRGFLLPLSERERLREAGGPLADVDLTAMRPEALPVVEVDGRIVAYWPCFYALHLEPVHINAAYRGMPAVGRALLEQLQVAVAQIGEPVAFALLGPDAASLPMATRLGFDRAPGDLYYVTQPARPPAGVA